jgi:hypothetical protein
MDKPDCKALYTPDPDIAGAGIILSLLVHASIYIILGLIIAPYIHLFFRQVTPARGINEYDPEGVKREARRSLLTSKCRDAIVDSFGSQYIVGLSFIIVGFIRHTQTSYYHVRIIHALASMNFVGACVSQYNLVATGAPLGILSKNGAPG